MPRLRSRRETTSGGAREPGTVSVRLAVRQPFAADRLIEFLSQRSVPGVELVEAGTYSRTLDLPRGHGAVELTPADAHVAATFRLSDWRDLAPAVGRIRRLLDLDADPVAIDESLSGHAALATLVRARPGMRVAGSVDPAETLIRAIVGQQVSVAGARTVLGRIAASLGKPVDRSSASLTHLFPTMESLAAAPSDAFPMPTRRADTIRRAAEQVASGALVLDPGTDRHGVVARLVALPGIGPWTARYVVMRGLGDPDVLLDTDLGVRHALAALDISADRTADWKPWRSYAMHHLWATL
jgi:AraC family transcriptional regulator, regulatory protein of adaptative response / DNA-3-methyladenine glycosylase II